MASVCLTDFSFFDGFTSDPEMTDTGCLATLDPDIAPTSLFEEKADPFLPTVVIGSPLPCLDLTDWSGGFCEEMLPLPFSAVDVSCQTTVLKRDAASQTVTRIDSDGDKENVAPVIQARKKKYSHAPSTFERLVERRLSDPLESDKKWLAYLKELDLAALCVCDYTQNWQVICNMCDHLTAIFSSKVREREKLAKKTKFF